MNAIQNTIRNSEKVKTISCYCKLNTLVAHLRELSNHKMSVSSNPEIAKPLPIHTTVTSGYGVLMYVNR